MLALDASSIERYFEATEPRRGDRYLFLAMAMVLILMLMILPAYGDRLGIPDLLGVLLVGALLGLLVAVGWGQRWKHRRLRQLLILADECEQLREWDKVPVLLERVFGKPIMSSLDRAEAFLLLAGAARHAHHYEAAGQIYETLMLRQMGSLAQVRQAEIGLATVKIRNQELTDAVNLLARLEKVDLPPGLRAGLDLVRLIQQVYMGHCADAVQELPQRHDLYRRCLSTSAAEGYGLLAYALHTLGRTAEAARWWADATALIDSERLVREHSLLADLARQYPATEHLV